MAAPKDTIDLAAYMAGIKDRDGGFVLSSDGQLVASDHSIPGQNIDWVGEFLELMSTIACYLEEANISGLESGLLQGPKRKLVIRRNPRYGFFVVIIGRETMDVGQAGLTAKNISLELESALGLAT